MCTVWHVDKYKITFKLVINSRWNLSRPGIIDAMARYRAAARRLRDTALQLLSQTFFILRRTERDMIENLYGSASKVTVILVRFYLNFNFLDRFSENIQITNLLVIRPMGAELFHVDGRTDMTKLIVIFRNFTNALKNSLTNERPTWCHLLYFISLIMRSTCFGH